MNKHVREDELDLDWIDRIGALICTVLLVLAGGYFVAQLVYAWWLGRLTP